MSGKMNEGAWAQLSRYAPAATAYLQEQFASVGGRLSFDAAGVAESLALPVDEVRADLVLAVALGVLDRIASGFIHSPCGSSLTIADVEAGICPVDGDRFDSDELRRYEFFIRDGPPSRDVPWVLCIHGMNTRGAWQEALAWRIATSYRRAVPVYVYKYGLVHLGAILRWRQREIADRLAHTIRNLSGEPEGSRLGPRPDVICHSFGTWMIGHALLRDESLKVGRVVLVASILRPDFPWQKLLDRGQVEAVLSHRGGRDATVALAVYTIPNSGPSGRSGFNPDVPVTDLLDPAFAHSTFFELDRLEEIFLTRWKPFLVAEEVTPTLGLREPWNPPSWVLAATVLPLLLSALLTAIVLLLFFIFVKGLASM